MGRVMAGSKKTPGPDKSAGGQKTPESSHHPPRQRYIIESASASEIRKAYGISDEEMERIRERMAEFGLR